MHAHTHNTHTHIHTHTHTYPNILCADTQTWELLTQEAQDEDVYLKELAGVDDLNSAASLQVCSPVCLNRVG